MIRPGHVIKRSLFTLALVGLTLATGSSAFGDVFSFYLTVDDFGDTAPPADAVLVTINQTSDTAATVTFTGETIGPNTYYMDDVFFNVNGDFTVGTITGTQASYSASPHQGIDTFGTMSEEIAPTPNHPSSTITIALTAAGGNTWADAFDVLTRTCPDNNSVPSCVGGFDVPAPDAGGGYNPSHYAQGFDADATVGTSSSSVSSDSDLAGFAVPEPASLLLFGSIVLLLATFARRKSAAS